MAVDQTLKNVRIFLDRMNEDRAMTQLALCFNTA